MREQGAERPLLLMRGRIMRRFRTLADPSATRYMRRFLGSSHVRKGRSATFESPPHFMTSHHDSLIKRSEYGDGVLELPVRVDITSGTDREQRSLKEGT